MNRRVGVWRANVSFVYPRSWSTSCITLDDMSVLGVEEAANGVPQRPQHGVRCMHATGAS